MYDGLHVDVTEAIIGCAIEVHKQLGRGLLESVYETALCIELTDQKLPVRRQIGVPLYYKQQLISEHRQDLVVADVVIVEIKNVLRLEPIHVAQMLTYLKVTGPRIGLILNFNTAAMKQGVRRVAL